MRSNGASEVRADLLAGKLECGVFSDMDQTASPRLALRWRELLWFLQAISIKPDGLEHLVKALLRDYAPRFITRSMRDAGEAAGERYTLAQCLKAWVSFDRKIANHHVRRFGVLPNPDDDYDPRPGDPELFADFLGMHFSSDLSPDDVQAGKDCDTAAMLAALEKFNWPFLNGLCLERCSDSLASFLVDLCVEKGTKFNPPWFCCDLFNILLDHMDRHSADTLKTIAQTEVQRIVFRELEFSCSQNVPTPIIGKGIVGAKSAAATWCAMRPGRARLVNVPESNREREFIEAHAAAFGIEYDSTTTIQALKWKVEYVHLHSGLFIAYEAAEFLVPIHYSKSTPPARLNWVQNRVLKRGLPCAFLAAPDSYRQTLDQYLKTTGRKMEEWLDHLPPAVLLPVGLQAADMMAVARHNFPAWPEPFLGLIASRAMLCERYLTSMESTIKRANFIAQERGHPAVTIEDVREAIAAMMPETVAQAPRRDDPAPPQRTVRSSPAPLPPGAGRGHAPQDFAPALPDPETARFSPDGHVHSTG